MGKIPPTLTLLEIGDLSLERFRGIFRLGYQGDAWLEVKCRVQANPLSHNPHLASHPTLPLATPLLASQPLLVPMTLRLSSLHLRAILILVVSASKGITLVFKNDPLQNVDVSSTFDSIEVIRGYLQQEIEGQLREMFREDLPGIIHRLSQGWFNNAAGMGGRVEMPYRHETIPIDGPDDQGDPDGVAAAARKTANGINHGAEEDYYPFDPDREREIFPSSSSSAYTASHTESNMVNGSHSYNNHINIPDANTSGNTSTNLGPSPSRRRSTRSQLKKSSTLSSAHDSPTTYTTFPEIEDYDPTYGLRPEGVPSHAGYEAFGRLWEKAREGKQKGLGSLMSLAEDLPFGKEADEMDDLLEEDEDDGGERRTSATATGLTRTPDSEYSDDENASVDQVEISPSLKTLARTRGLKSNSNRGQATPVPMPMSLNPALRHQLGRKTSSSIAGLSSVAGRSPPLNHSGYMNNRSPSARYEDVLEWETVSAVGGGTISRPRIFHAQSQIRAPSEYGSGIGGGGLGMMPSPSGTMGTVTGGSVTARASSVRSSAGGSTLGLGVARDVLQEGRSPFIGRVGSVSAVENDVFGTPSPARHLHPHAPSPTRRHSRAESVPSHILMAHRNQIRQPSRLGQQTHGPPNSNLQRRGTESSRDALQSSFSPPPSYTNNPQSASTGPKARPISITGYPSQNQPTPSTWTHTPQRQRKPSVSSFNQPNSLSTSPPSRFFIAQSQPSNKSKSIVLPLNDSVSQLATLSHSNHTLSPYARNHEHIAIRSFPHLLSRSSSIYGNIPNTALQSGVSQSNSGALVHSSLYPHGHAHSNVDLTRYKARRKRIYKLGGAKSASTSTLKPTTPDEERRSDASTPLGQPLQPPPPYRASSSLVTSDDTPQGNEKRPFGSQSSNRPPLTGRRSYGFPVVS